MHHTPFSVGTSFFHKPKVQSRRKRDPDAKDTAT